MGVTLRYVEADKKTGRLSYRRVYPPDVRRFVPKQARELKRSLRAKTLNDPQASRLYADAHAEFERNLAMARRMAGGSTRPLREGDTTFLVGVYVHRLRKNLSDTHWDRTDASRDWISTSAWRYAPFAFMDEIGAVLSGRGGAWTNAQRLREGLPKLLAEWRMILADGIREALIAAEGQTAEDLCQEHGLTFDSQSEPFFCLCRHLLDADIATAQQLARMVDPEDATPIEVPSQPQPLERLPEANELSCAASSGSVPLLDLYDGYASAQGITPRVRSEWRSALQHLISFLGHDDASRIGREDVQRWRDNLLTSPGRQGRARKPVTVRDKYLVVLRCTLSWAVSEERLSHNPAADVFVRVPRTAKIRDKDFTLEEAHAILRASLVKPSAALSPASARARRWLPWLCAYSGARVGELAQLRTKDVRQEDGVWALNITPEAGAVKTKEARLVPLHPHLIEQGFVDMVRKLPEGPIFYDPAKRRVSGDGNNRHVQKVGERLAEWVRKTVGIDDPSIKPNHAWRHLFKTIAGEAGMAEKTADAIQGHTPANVSRRYGKVSVKTKAEAIRKFPYFDIYL